MSLNSFQENATRLGMRLQETISEHTKDLTFGRHSGITFFDTSEDKVKNIRKQLESSLDSEKLEALKRLIAMISKGRNVSEFFAQVVKNVASKNLEIRKLVYIYLLRYTEQEPDLALLSINTFQKDLSDSNPLIRSMALRVLSGIKVPMIGSIVVLGIKKCAADPNPYVRKAAALAIPKLISIDPSHLTDLESVILTLLRDRSPVSIGYVAEAFNTVFFHRLELLHSHYRRLCRILVDVDEWGQISLMNLLLRYSKQMLSKPQEGEEDQYIDSDLLLLLDGVDPLFQSRNPAVVMTACRVFHVIKGQSSLAKIIPTLLRLTDSDPISELRRTVLSYISLVITKSEGSQVPYPRFYVRMRDSSQIKLLKLKILLQLATSDNIFILLRELKDYCLDTDDIFATESMRAIGRCAAIVPESTQQCLNILIEFIQSPHDIVVSNAILVLRSLIQAHSTSSNPPSNLLKPLLKIIGRLAYHIEEIRHPDALGCSLWLIGQYASEQDITATKASGVAGIADWAPDALRKMAKRFSHECSAVKLQIIALTAKLRVLNPNHHTLDAISRYVFSLARYDIDYDVRDRARMLSSLIVGLTPDSQGFERGGVVLRSQQIEAVLFVGKTHGLNNDRVIEVSDSSVLGSLGPLLGQTFFETDVSPYWLEQGTEAALRDTEDDVPQPGVPILRSTPSTHQSPRIPVILTPGDTDSPTGSYLHRSKWIDLDKFYESAEEDSDESDEYDEEEGEEGVEGEEGAEGAEEGAEETSESDKEDGTDEEETDDRERGYRDIEDNVNEGSVRNEGSADHQGLDRPNGQKDRTFPNTTAGSGTSSPW